MPFKLRIDFSGLCLFVPDRRDPNHLKMHVLMPDVRGHHGHRHELKLFVNKAHLTAGHQTPSTHPLEHRRLDDQHVTVTGASPGADLSLPAQIVDLSKTAFAGKKVAAALVDNDNAPRVGARFTLGAGKLVWSPKGTSWKIRGTPACMTHRAIWEIEENGGADAIDLDMRGLNGKPKLQVEKLHKTRADSRIDIHVYNARPGDTPGNQPGDPPKKGHVAEHFDAYYDLFPAGANRGNPVLEEEGMETCGEEVLAAFIQDAFTLRDGVDPFRCMIAGGGTLP